MLSIARRTAAVAICALCSALCAEDDSYYRTYDSPYNHLIVRRQDSIVTFRRMENGAVVSAIDLDDPLRQVVPYTRTLFAGSFFMSEPRRVLSIGLGAGAFNRLFNEAFPDAVLVSAELDPLVVRLAEDYTEFEVGQRNQVEIRDGRMFLRRSHQIWDWIILDAFTRRSQVPAHMTTLEFYELAASRLSTTGVFVENLPSTNKLFFSLVHTLRAASPQVVFFQVPGKGNIIAVASNYPAPDLAHQLAQADAESMPEVLNRYLDMPFMRTTVLPDSARRLNGEGQVLTDDFMPAEYLEAIEIE